MWRCRTYYSVEHTTKYPKVNDPSYTNDIALLRTKYEIAFKENVEPILYSDYQVPENTSLLISKYVFIKMNYSDNF